MRIEEVRFSDALTNEAPPNGMDLDEGLQAHFPRVDDPDLREKRSGLTSNERRVWETLIYSAARPLGRRVMRC